MELALKLKRNNKKKQKNEKDTKKGLCIQDIQGYQNEHHCS